MLAKQKWKGHRMHPIESKIYDFLFFHFEAFLSAAVPAESFTIAIIL
jgi:hypothetical protein